MPSLPPDDAQSIIDSFHAYRDKVERSVSRYRSAIRRLIEQSRQQKIAEVKKNIASL